MTLDEFGPWVQKNLCGIGYGIRTFLGLVVGVCSLYTGLQNGRPIYYLLRDTVKTNGVIIGSKAEEVPSSSFPRPGFGYTAYRPIVQFYKDDKPLQFTDWKGFSRSPILQQPVPVIYNLANPAQAMIDRGYWNFIPWFPLSAIGVLLLLYGFWHAALLRQWLRAKETL